MNNHNEPIKKPIGGARRVFHDAISGATAGALIDVIWQAASNAINNRPQILRGSSILSWAASMAALSAVIGQYEKRGEDKSYRQALENDHLHHKIDTLEARLHAKGNPSQDSIKDDPDCPQIGINAAVNVNHVTQYADHILNGGDPASLATLQTDTSDTPPKDPAHWQQQVAEAQDIISSSREK